MIEIKDIDPTHPFVAQFDEAGADPVVVINTFVYPDGAYGEVVEAWRLDSEVMKASPGYVSAQLYGGVGSNVLTTVAVWESAAHLKAAFYSKAFQDLLAAYPDGTVAYPHLERRIAVPNVCVA
jgi:heme-degrading monooxygenase HmoA